ncbi:hypothetical protein HY57_01320 [Dyella japonica A8]|uniref:Uncharacterized protein n=2 Tax=Dyella japonica TaxID=231455 RepID=A0A075JWT2_9GAMM|nr:hypothetical protein HY57_01320 [Dyella japonica A8]
MSYYTREQLQEILSELDAAIPQMKASHPDETELVMAFAERANAAGRNVSDADAGWFIEQLSAIQHRHSICG